MAGLQVTETITLKIQMAAAQLGADAVIVQGAQPQSQRDYWHYPKTSGTAIEYTD
jgi:hypothetical protein